MKAVVKLYKDPQAALEALETLKASGFSDSEVGLLRRSNGLEPQAGVTRLALPQLGDGIASGYLAAALSQGAAKGEDLDKALAGALGVPPDALDYYKFGVSLGGVLVSVQADTDKLAKAKQILRQATGLLPLSQARATGFSHADRMTATDPVDAPMSGDFRRY